MSITATHINYYHICHRKLWLFAHGLNMEHTSDTVTEGKLIGENTYTDRAAKYTELELEGIKIDYYDARNKVVHEIKKSDKMEVAHEAQVKYYLYKLKQHGIEGATGILEYPSLRHTAQVELTDQDIVDIQRWEIEILDIINREEIHAVIHKTVCKRCSYYEFCYC
ncbi:MAG TPA: CRISPR-associated protein Cas4 [Saprospiraceae bacterium]|nr:CRISPR-associated protein Cas4 [Saprospiraceae bacterium]MBK8828324.1 CRISPR-associated protein Cas4 [Saprospiraceae bacterium]MBK9583097.1 CRISPR-associated protein Cas4 [Saprospiraceae bacterium]HQV67109.1 CRISPR-associated protein Cas4 [Saprospiraceae bacterium]HRG40256.1 CRISPR-associated protein Cas4 [Saprospiraceae bacterium]